MFVKKLQLINFRNYDNVEFEFNKNLNIIIGNNAQGKTNIIEAIYTLAITKSPITTDDKRLIKIGAGGCRINSIINYDKIQKKISYVIKDGKKSIKVNDQTIPRLSNYIGMFNVVFFGPNDLNLIKSYPALRRRFLNIEISQIDNNYVKLLSEYNNILRMRNEYLKTARQFNSYNQAYFDVLNDKYVVLASKVYFGRKKYIEQINKYYESIYFQITADHNARILYNSSIVAETLEEYQNKFRDLLVKTAKLEEKKGITIYGVHHDDFYFLLDNNNLSKYGSQGQQKMAVLTLKLAEIVLFKEYFNINPVILLDDIFSELDLTKRKLLLKYIGHMSQVIITTTDIANIDDELLMTANIYEIDQGQVKSEIRR